VAAVFPEVSNLFLFVAGVYGMFQGTDINHPVYALLFSNLIFPLVATILNFVILIFATFDQWMRGSMITNYLSTHFHLVSWSIISILRFLYLEHQSWLDSKFPDVKKLQIVSLLAQFGVYLLLLALDLTCVAIVAVPYGWPQKTFIHHVPKNLQIQASLFFVLIFLFPLLVSVTCYFFLHCSSNKVGITPNINNSKRKNYSLKKHQSQSSVDPNDNNRYDSENPNDDNRHGSEHPNDDNRLELQNPIDDDRHELHDNNSLNLSENSGMTDQNNKENSSQSTQEGTKPHRRELKSTSENTELQNTDNVQRRNQLQRLDLISDSETTNKRDDENSSHSTSRITKVHSIQLTSTSKLTTEHDNGNSSKTTQRRTRLDLLELDSISVLTIKQREKELSEIALRTTKLQMAQLRLTSEMADQHNLGKSSKATLRATDSQSKEQVLTVGNTGQLSDGKPLKTYLGKPQSENIQPFEIMDQRNNDMSAENSVCHSDFENEQEQKRFEVKKESTMRALKTNLLFSLFISLSLLALVFPSDSWSSYVICLLASVQKGLLPITTTMANFGTIRSVTMKFMDKIFQS
jgi:hypothetical protein